MLLPMTAVGAPLTANRSVSVNMLMERIKNSPGLDFDQPISRQFKATTLGYYGLNPFFAAGFTRSAIPWQFPLPRRLWHQWHHQSSIILSTKTILLCAVWPRSRGTIATGPRARLRPRQLGQFCHYAAGHPGADTAASSESRPLQRISTIGNKIGWQNPKAI